MSRSLPNLQALHTTHLRVLVNEVQRVWDVVVPEVHHR